MPDPITDLELARVLDSATFAMLRQATRFQEIAADSFRYSRNEGSAPFFYGTARRYTAQAAVLKALADEAWAR